MTLPRLAAMTEYWRSSPPLHQLVAAYIGYKPAVKAKMIEQDLSSMFGVQEVKHGN